MNITDLLAPVAQIARRCPTVTLIDAYRRAARDFCGQSRWYRVSIAIATSADEPTYSVLVPSGFNDLEVIGVRLIRATDPRIQSYWQVFPKDITLFDPSVGPAAPRWYAYDPESGITFYQTPDNVYDMAVTLQCQPAQTASEVPDAILPKWERVLQAGALANLLAIPGQTWSSSAESVRYAKVFQAGINNAKADEQRGYNTGSVRVRPRAFVVGR